MVQRNVSVADIKNEIAQKNGYWGYHLILDCAGCNKNKITDKKNLIQFINVLVSAIDMKAFGKPVVEHFAEHDLDKAGFSLVQLIETSSITGHFVDKNGDAYLDIFSCKEFDIEMVKKVIDRFFEPQKIKVCYLTRQA
ncbi:MAG TPA: S-adenosylmethionine decarboxylase [Rhabdochlamydiaceae bacterium]|nr:S-adenosylmethionine decarboxylase [Rhabdochlamydiaceae bacterium]